jgi:hypothetical protein
VGGLINKSKVIVKGLTIGFLHVFGLEDLYLDGDCIIHFPDN